MLSAMTGQFWRGDHPFKQRSVGIKELFNLLDSGSFQQPAPQGFPVMTRPQPFLNPHCLKGSSILSVELML